jgi:hypothetical protein
MVFLTFEFVPMGDNGAQYEFEKVGVGNGVAADGPFIVVPGDICVADTFGTHRNLESR